jgi:hypothetical protein
MSSVQVVQGFSPLNRALLYISMMLAPAQFAAGLGSNCPSNIGFLAYNWYTQLQWYQAARKSQLHALSILVSEFNFCFTVTYLGGVSSGNYLSALLVGFGTVGVMVLNNVVAWTSWSTAQVQGYGVYEFWFFGWRTLGPHWHRYLCVVQIIDTLALIGSAWAAIVIAFRTAQLTKDAAPAWWYRYQVIFGGGIGVLLSIWPIMMWMELTVRRNHIVSETDTTAVWLFVVQLVTMLAPPCFGCYERRHKTKRNKPDSGPTELTKLVSGPQVMGGYQDAPPEEQRASVRASAEP